MTWRMLVGATWLEVVAGMLEAEVSPCYRGDQTEIRIRVRRCRGHIHCGLLDDHRIVVVAVAVVSSDCSSDWIDSDRVAFAVAAAASRHRAPFTDANTSVPCDTRVLVFVVA